MLSKGYFLAKFRFDTAENEPAKNLQNFAKFAAHIPRARRGTSEGMDVSDAPGATLVSHALVYCHIYAGQEIWTRTAT